MKPIPVSRARTPSWALLAPLVLGGLSACGGGGGGGGDPVPPTLGPLTVSLAPALAGSGGLTVRLTLPADATGRGLSVPWRTAELNGAATGFATAGAACGGAVDFVAVAGGSAAPVGLDASVTVTLCPNSSLEPNERFEIQFDWNGSTQRFTAVIVNDAAGGLNDTGATRCLDDTGAQVACSATTLARQDAALGRDAGSNTNSGADGRLGFAFAAVAGGSGGAGCTRDLVTGLVWSTASNASSALAAEAAVSVANSASRCGFSDWRLPTVLDLASLVDSGATAAPRIDPTLDASAGGTPLASFWSAEAYAGDTRGRWVVDFNSGAIGFETDSNPLAKPAAVRMVRGATAAGSAAAACDEANPARYTDHGNGTVTDRATGLMWMQCSDGLSGSDCTSGRVLAYAGIGAALARAQAVNTDRTGAGRGFDDWRVPNRNELASLVNRSCQAPAVQRIRFPNTPQLATWTATPAATGFVWYVDFNDGSVAPGGTSGDRVLRLVRAGQ